ncbi:MAG: phosphoenolpyruvate carboxykinase (GTP) [Candidatus Saganbacteria bacterium]|nr:phosphoenolpyruvate carboxykinase (GTP) [Candidatus Saganbacteria bacterium]
MDLKEKCGELNFKKLEGLNNPKLIEFVTKYVEHCNPDSLFVRTDSKEDAQYIRDKAEKNGEESKLAAEGHTYHFDGLKDQARDKANTKYLLPSGVDLGPNINSTDKVKGLDEVHGFLKNSMQGKEMYIAFFCLGPTNSDFSISAVQITDSSYVVHSEGILYRSGYEQFKNAKDFFRFVHTAGVLENGVCINVDKRRVYIDLEDNIVFSTNTQYAGNTVGLKKLSLRLAIQKAMREEWLAEHMLVMGVHGPKDRVTYFTGAFPSACGKTSTSMIQGETIVGDDIAYLRNKDGVVVAANVEAGIFGIIRDVNAQGDPQIFKALTSPGEVIFSNVLITDGVPHWLGDGREMPKKGINYSGDWSEGSEHKPSHMNARYTIRISALENRDPKADAPEGVPVGGIIYGGRDSDTWVPVKQAFDWNHGVITMGASIESETTAATLGKSGVRKFNIMSNMDFVSVPLSEYINKYLEFGAKLKNPPSVFAVNYFLKDKEGNYISGIKDKAVWVKWMELRVNGDVEAIKTATGYIPKYEDLKKLFKQVLNKDYTEESYKEMFTLRVKGNLEKIERIKAVYQKVPNAPDILFKILDDQKQRLSG